MGTSQSNSEVFDRRGEELRIVLKWLNNNSYIQVVCKGIISHPPVITVNRLYPKWVVYHLDTLVILNCYTIKYN